MDSFIQSPAAHAAAVKDPQLLGGPFMDLPADRLECVRQLADETRKSPLAELSRAICEIDEMLKANANGYSLESLYALVPAPLRGYVELVYDLHNHASFRLFERLLYKSPYYNDKLQSIMLSLISHDDRPFVLSTPRFEEEGKVHLKIPFSQRATGLSLPVEDRRRPHFLRYETRLGFSEQESKVFQHISG